MYLLIYLLLGVIIYLGLFRDNFKKYDKKSNIFDLTVVTLVWPLALTLYFYFKVIK